MCGRFVLAISGEAIAASMGAAPLLPAFVEALAAWQPRWNIAPSSVIPVVRAASEGRRELLLMRWGLVPAWASDATMGQRLTNARADSIAIKPAFRDAWRRRRCLIPATAWYEWQAQPDGGRKRPYAFASSSGEPLALAGIWEHWVRRERQRDAAPVVTEPSLFDALPPHAERADADEDAILSIAIITTEANACVGSVHDRMPVLIAPEDRDRWLHATDAPSDLLRPAPADHLRSWPVSLTVSDARIDAPACLAPLG